MGVKNMNDDLYSLETTKQFFEKYIKFEQIRADSPQIFERFYDKYKASFDMFRSTRNILAHNKVGLTKENYPLIVSKYMLDELNKMIDRMTVKAYSKAIKISEIASVETSTSLYDAIKLMNEKNYSYLPLIKDEKIEYVVSEKAIITILANNKEGVVYDKTVTVGDYIDYFKLDNNSNEFYSFVGRETLAYDLNNEFNKIKDGKKCGLLFVTQSGKKDEKVLGMITLWDVAF